MGFFNRKEKESFDATKKFMVDVLQYDENRNLIKIKNGFKSDIIAVNSIDSIKIGFNGKVYNETDTRTVINGILAGTYKEDIGNIQIRIKADKKFYFAIVSIGKLSANKAERLLTSSLEAVNFINSVK